MADVLAVYCEEIVYYKCSYKYNFIDENEISLETNGLILPHKEYMIKLMMT
jgi:hypothetical protein